MALQHNLLLTLTFSHMLRQSMAKAMLTKAGLQASNFWEHKETRLAISTCTAPSKECHFYYSHTLAFNYSSTYPKATSNFGPSFYECR